MITDYQWDQFINHCKLVYNEGKNMEQINTYTDTPVNLKPALTDEELDVILAQMAQGTVVSVDDADEKDEEKVLN